LLTTEYRTLNYVTGPLIFVNNVHGVAYSEMVDIKLPDGSMRTGQVLEVSGDIAVIQVFEGTRGIDIDRTTVSFREEGAMIDVSTELLGRVLNGTGKPIDGGAPIMPETRLDVTGNPINPYTRDKPADFIETGISAIDGLNTLVRGQKLPIFSGSGLPANELAAQIIRQARVKSGEEFAIVFAAMGITHREAAYFMSQFERTGALERVVFFMNLADDPTVERLLTPKVALTVAEYLAFEKDLQVRKCRDAVATRATCTPTSRPSTSAPAASRDARAPSRSSRSCRCPTTTSRTLSPTSPATSPRVRSCCLATCIAAASSPRSIRSRACRDS
jgi:V/A-type H+-transporting ATPase subunit B